MNILILNWRDIKHSWAGGSELYVHELAKRWTKDGNKVTLFSGQDISGDLPEREIIDGISIVRKGGRFSVYIWAMIYYLREFKKNADLIVDVENGIPFFTPFYSRKRKICLVYHVHADQWFYELPFPLNSIGYFLEKRIFPITYRNIPIMAISKSTKKALVKLGFSEKNITIVEPGVSMKNSNIEKINKYKTPTLIYLGRIKKYKRIDLLIEVFTEVLKKIPNAQLIIAGWGSEAPLVTDVVMRSKTRRKIHIFGPVTESEKKTLLAKSWVFVSPSLHEGWGISIIETNLLKTPTVSFNVPGLSDSIKNGYNGFVCEDKKDMVNVLNKLLTDREKREELSSNARIWAQQFTWERAAKLSLKVLHK